MKRFPLGLKIAAVGLTTVVFAINTEKRDKLESATEKTSGDKMVASLSLNPINFSKIYRSSIDINFRVKGKNERPVTKQKLNNAKALNDIFEYYPENWIDKYESVEISAEIHGKVEKASASNKVLSKEQKRILHSAELADNINVLVKYKVKNYVSDQFEDKQLNYTLTVIPEKEAEYKCGHNDLIRYLVENSRNKLSAVNANNIEPAYIWFTINETGKAADIDLKKSSGYPKIDQLVLELIRDMPQWNPAENSKGEKVKQNFELAFGGAQDEC